MTIAQSFRTVSAFLVLASCLVGSGPADAQQLDLSGEWNTIYHEDGPHRGAGPELGDYSGIPLNDAGRLKAESWDASSLSLRERQCIPRP